MDVWIKEEDGVTDYEGEVWPGAIYINLAVVSYGF